MSTRCYTPMWHDKHQSNIACGRCPGCTKKRASGWGFRLMKEAERSCSAFFITLTYDNHHVPRTRNKFLTLKKTDPQLFFKRLRKRHNKHNYAKLFPIKYYLAGEYGDINARPHYHVILFNSTYQDILDAWTDPDTQKALGEIYFGSLNPTTISYTLKYISKPRTIPLHARDDRSKEFSLMSKGLGSNYINQKTIRWHTNDLLERYYIPQKGGTKIPMPKYYRTRIYDSVQFGLLKGRLEQLTIKKEQDFQQLHGKDAEFIRSQRHMADFRKMYKKNHYSKF